MNKSKGFGDVIMGNFLSNWTAITEIKKPIIAAVNGFALGGGCEVLIFDYLKLYVKWKKKKK